MCVVKGMVFVGHEQGGEIGQGGYKYNGGRRAIVSGGRVWEKGEVWRGGSGGGVWAFGNREWS